MADTFIFAGIIFVYTVFVCVCVSVGACVYFPFYDRLEFGPVFRNPIRGVRISFEVTEKRFGTYRNSHKKESRDPLVSAGPESM